MILAGCSEHLPTGPEQNAGKSRPAAMFSLAKAGVELGSNTQIYAGFVTPADAWQILNQDGYSVPTVLECYFALRSGTTANDSMLISGIDVVTNAGTYPAMHYSTTVDGAFFWVRPLPDGSVDSPRGSNLNQIVWVQIGTDSTVSKSTLDNWAGTGAWVRLPMVRGNVARCWAGGSEVLVSIWSKRTGGIKISEIHPHHWVTNGQGGWNLEFGVDSSGIVYQTGEDNTHIQIRP